MLNVVVGYVIRNWVVKPESNCEIRTAELVSFNPIFAICVDLNLLLFVLSF